MIVAVPGLAPHTKPVRVFIVATSVLSLAQVPPVTASLSVFDEPVHICIVPAIAGGAGFTVTTAERVHPKPNE